jgi:two-component system response regulator YesN
MYQVVVISESNDIEKILTNNVNLADFGCNVAEICIDSYTAGLAVKNLHPSILLTDVHLQGEDLLPRIKTLLVENALMEVAILTDCRDFEVARTALNIGVTKYLLLPPSPEELYKAFASITSRLRLKGLLPDTGPLAGKETSSGSFIVHKAIEYVEQHYSEKLTLAEVAEKIYVSRWHLSKLLNGYLSKGFSDLLGEARVNSAKILLENPSLKIHEISSMVGFAHVSHFSKTFHSIVGTSPNIYRNQLHK